MKDSQQKKAVILYCCMYDECGRTFGTKYNLKRHVQTTHKKEKRFSCPHCEKKFASKQGVVEHTFIHTGERPFVCVTCNIAFRQVSQLSLHMRTHGKDSKPVSEKKPFCGMTSDIEERSTPVTKFSFPPITNEKRPMISLPSLFNSE